MSLAVHYSAWINHPIEHINALFSHSLPYHPILYVLIIYILIALVRGCFYLVKKLFSKK